MAQYISEPKEFEEKVVQVNRVSKKTSGGSVMRFSVLVVVGDKKSRVGVGLGQALEVQSAVRKAVAYAKKHLFTVPMKGTTIPHEVLAKFGAAKVLLRPAPPGSGVIAGGAVRAVVEAAGIRDISSKVLGTENQANNVYATLEGLKKLRLGRPGQIITPVTVAPVIEEVVVTETVEIVPVVKLPAEPAKKPKKFKKEMPGK